MRIIVGSAHYPPNFTSGGTLQPQRMARGLRQRGHAVSVFAGWLGERPPLSEFDEVDETGLPVHWIVTTPWTAWGDPKNHENPDVTAAFARHLAEHRPDVVHLHSIQTLGVGLVEAAKGAGARVVVTMHDFWWTCARQFLVDRRYHPCSEVVDLGNCECERGRDALAARTARLEEALRAADLVLAPSQSAADILNANGAAGGRVVVDENGMDEVPVAAPRRVAPGPSGVRFLFTGGPDPMKGWPVLLEAARGLAGVPGWSLDGYGFDRLEALPASLPAGLPVRVHPPYPPSAADAVFGASDVLVVPSVMRESHSLVTREALLRGLPVVVAASVGPEEVVAHGVNGLVVPADDPAALREAMRSLVEAPGQLPAMSERARSVTIRPIGEQIDELDRTLRDLVAHPPPPTTAATPAGRVRRVLFVAGIEGAPLRYRVRLPAEAIARHGVRSEVRHFFDPDLPALARVADVVVLYRVPATGHVRTTIEAAHDAGVPVLFDADDLIFDPGIEDHIPALEILGEDDARLWREGIHRYRTTLRWCDGFIGSTPALVDAAAQVAGRPTWCFPNGVGVVLGQASDAAFRRPRRGGPPRLAYLSGTDTHDLDWAYVAPAIASVLDRHPGATLQLIGLVPDHPDLARFADRTERTGFTHWLGLPGLLRDVDVNLAPLAPGSVFNEAKSAIKWIEAALVGTPTVASPTGPFRDAVDDGVTGLLAADLDGWEAAIGRLLDDAVAARRMGDAARRQALVTLSPARQAARYLAILDAALEAGPIAGPLADDGLAVEEQPRAAVLEPYGPFTAKEVARRRAADLRRQRLSIEVGRARTDGFLMTAKRVARRALRR